MSLPWTNTSSRYGVASMLIHWGMAVLLAVLTAMGWYMVRLPDAGFDTEKIRLILAHKSLGMAALLALLARVAWRHATVLPQWAAALPDWQRSAAYLMHLCLYALMLALPVTGWLMSSAGGFPVYLWFDRWLAPDLMRNDPSLFHFFIELHRWLAYALLVLAAAHAGASLAHHFVWRDDTLKKMLP